MLTAQNLRELIGPTPPKAALRAEVVERVGQEGFERLKVEYNVEPGERISAYLLLPNEASTPSPAVFCHHQHAGNFELGKSEVVGLAGDPDQAIGPELARLGFVVLAPDAIAFEERNWSFPNGRAEYIELVTRLVKGNTLIAKAIHDVSVGFDYLSSLEHVDDERMGFIGHSYGGRMAIWAAALDERIKASVSNCGCVDYRSSLERDVGIQAEFCVPGILRLGDVPDSVRLVAPRALLISATSDDKYSRGAERLFDYAIDAFPQDQLRLRIWDGVHIFNREMRDEAYHFLSEKL
jgi:dienelactone hydrolase